MDLCVLLMIFCTTIAGSFASDSQTYRCPSTVKVTKYVKTYGDHCYEFIPNEKNWYGAYDSCRSKGGGMVVIRDKGTQNFIVSTLKSFHWPRRGVWLGATDRKNEMDWKWVTNHRVDHGYTNWASGQPSCHILCFEDCALMRLDEGGLWHDYKCDWIEDYSYVCQYALLPKTTTTTTTTTITTSTTTQAPTTTTSKSTTTTTPVLNSTTNGTGFIVLKPSPDVKVQLLSNSQMSQLDHSSDSGANTISIIGLVLGLLLGLVLGLCLGVFFFRRRNRKHKEETPSVYFNNPFYADVRAPLNQSPEHEASACCTGGVSISQAPTPVKRPFKAPPPVPKRDYGDPHPNLNSRCNASGDRNHYDDITAQKLLYATKGTKRTPPRAVDDGEYEEPRYVEEPEDDLVDSHFDQITGENYYESMENVRLAIHQNAMNEQQEERYVPFQFDADELGHQR